MIPPTSCDPFDGYAIWDYEPWEISAVPSNPAQAVILVGGRPLPTNIARQLGQVLISAADYAEGKTC